MWLIQHANSVQSKLHNVLQYIVLGKSDCLDIILHRYTFFLGPSGTTPNGGPGITKVSTSAGEQGNKTALRKKQTSLEIKKIGIRNHNKAKVVLEKYTSNF